MRHLLPHPRFQGEVAKGRGGGGHVEHEGRLVGTGPGEGDRIRAEEWTASSMGSNGGQVGRACKSNKPCICYGLRFRPQRCPVCDSSGGKDANPVIASCLYDLVKVPMMDERDKGVVALAPQKRIVHPGQRRICLALDLATAKGPNVPRNSVQPVGARSVPLGVSDAVCDTRCMLLASSLTEQ
eukprot:6716-Hanusia_phi.AAC.1